MSKKKLVKKKPVSKKTGKEGKKTLKKAKISTKVKRKKKIKSASPKAFQLSSDERYLDLFSRGVFGKSLKQFHGISLDEYYNGQTIKNEFGETYVITYNENHIHNPIDHNIVEEKLLIDLKAIPGIAEITEVNLKKEGYKTIRDLTNHVKYKPHAESYIQYVTQRNGCKLYDLLSERFTSTNPALLFNSTYFDIKDVAFIDLETLGLHDCPLFLIGIASFENQKIKIDQIFINHLMDEKAALHYLFEHIKDKKAIFTYNGKNFDVPFLRKRLIRHDLTHEVSHPHFDVKNFSTRAFKDLVSDFRLQTLEDELLQLRRKDDVPGHLVPQFYESYIQSKNIGAIVPILDHNKQDLLSTINIYNKLHEIWIN